MIKLQKIFVKLLDEGVDVWRPVEAQLLHLPDIYKIAIAPHNIVPEDESWEFQPGDLVKVKTKIKDGVEIKIASEAFSGSIS